MDEKFFFLMTALKELDDPLAGKAAMRKLSETYGKGTQFAPRKFETLENSWWIRGHPKGGKGPQQVIVEVTLTKTIKRNKQQQK